MTTPPLLSSSPGLDERMDISPLPHKPAFQMELDSPTPHHTVNGEKTIASSPPRHSSDISKPSFHNECVKQSSGALNAFIFANFRVTDARKLVFCAQIFPGRRTILPTRFHLVTQTSLHFGLGLSAASSLLRLLHLWMNVSLTRHHRMTADRSPPTAHCQLHLVRQDRKEASQV